MARKVMHFTDDDQEQALREDIRVTRSVLRKHRAECLKCNRHGGSHDPACRFGYDLAKAALDAAHALEQYETRRSRQQRQDRLW